MSQLSFRHATADDLPFIVGLIVDDGVVPTNDDRKGADPAYKKALAEIEADPNNELLVATIAGERVGTLQLTYIPGLAGLGQRRCLVEAVHIAPAHRNKGLGSQMIGHAVERARERGCGLIQLTSNKARIDAHRFYQRLGFKQSHEGFKLAL